MSDGKAHNFGYEVTNDFNVSIPFCAGELDRAWQRRGAELSRGEERTEVLKSWMACALRPATAGNVCKSKIGDDA